MSNKPCEKCKEGKLYINTDPMLSDMWIPCECDKGEELLKRIQEPIIIHHITKSQNEPE